MVAQEAKLVGYEWISYYDEEQEKRFSDWDRASQCARCGRTIVHVYVVQHASGEVEHVGKECAHLALGWPRKSVAKLDRLVQEAMAIEARRASAIESWGKHALSVAQPTPALAETACYTRNRHFSGNCAVYQHTSGGYYALPDRCAEPVKEPTLKEPIGQGEALEASGWSRIS